jgi:hypothetical protein
MKKGMQLSVVPASMRELDYWVPVTYRLGGQSQKDYSW